MPPIKRDTVQTYIRVRADVHAKAVDLAWKKHMSLNALINQAVEEFIADEEADDGDD